MSALNELLADPTNLQAAMRLAASRRQSANDIPPEERQGMLSQIGQTVMPTLQYLGETLDKPGSALRGLLTGHPSHLLNLLPFSDAAGVTNPEDRVSGRSMLEQYGALGPNTPGLDMGDIGGFAAEVIADPLNFIAGPGKAIVKGSGLAAAAKLGKVSTPSSIVREIAAGERGLIGLKVPFTKESFAVFGKGRAASRVAEVMLTNPAWRATRQLFDPRVANLYGKAAQKAADAGYEVLQNASDDTLTMANKLLAMHGDIEGLYANQLKGVIQKDPSIMQSLMGASANPASTAADFAKMDVYDFTRSVGEAQKAKRLASVAGELQASANLGGATLPQQIFAAAAKLDEYITGSLDLQDNMFASYKALGGQVADLGDKGFAGHVYRGLNRTVAEAMTAVNKKTGKAWDYSGVLGAIRRTIPDVPGGTNKINMISKDARLAAADHFTPHTPGMVPPPDLAARTKILVDDYGIPLTRPAVNPKDPPIAFAEELAKQVASWPPEVLKDGIFSRDMATDAAAYTLDMARRKAALHAVHDLVVDAADTNGIGPSVLQAMKHPAIRMSDEGLDTLAQKVLARMDQSDATKALAGQLKAAGAKTDDILSSVALPEDFAHTASKYFEFHANPKSAYQLVQWYDKLLAMHKGLLYSPFLASHNRNLISGLWQNAVTAFENPALFGQAAKEVFNVLRGKGSEHLQSFINFGLADSGLAAELSGVRRVADEAVPTVKGLFKPLKDANWLTNPIGRNSPYSPANMRGGLMPGQEEGSKFILGAMGEKAGPMVEFINRFMHYAARRKAGWTEAGAARSVKMAHFEYSDLSQFEKQYMRRLVPFWTFSRKNLPLQLQQLMDAPGGKTAQTIRLINNVRDQQKGQFIPRWLGSGLAISLGVNEATGASQYGVMSNVLPVEEAFNRFAPGNPVRTAENFLSATTPAVQAPLQAISGRQFWSHRPKDTLHQWPTDYENVNDALAQGPLARFASTARKLADPRKSVGSKLFNTLVGGASFTDIDESAIKREIRDILREKFAHEPGVGMIHEPYARQPDRISEGTLRQLSLYRALERELQQPKSPPNKEGAKIRKQAKKAALAQ